MVDLEMAIELSQSGRPGPAVIEIPLDVQSALSPIVHIMSRRN